MKNELEIEGKLEFANYDQRRFALFERYEIAAAHLPFDHKTTVFEETLDGKIERTFQSRTPINESSNCPEESLMQSLASAFSAAMLGSSFLAGLRGLAAFLYACASDPRAPA